MNEEHEDYTDEKSHAADVEHPDGAHAVHDEHGHDESSLGPIDWPKWGYAVIGAIGGVIVVAMFWLALGGLPA